MKSGIHKKIALVYDRVNKWGGAERVLLALHELFPDAPLYTSVYAPEAAPWANTFNIYTSFLQNIPSARYHHELLPFLMPIAFESFSFDEYDLVISVTSEAAKGILTKPSTKHICYCLTPTRYLWSGYEEYFANVSWRITATPLIKFLRHWDTIAAQRPDAYIAISSEVQQRIKKYYGRDSEVVYPPAPEFETRNAKSTMDSKDEYFLVVSRLSKYTKYKRVDLAVQACSELGLPLKVVGAGSWEAELQQMAGPTVEFLGQVTDRELVGYYKNCKALIFPGIEDFGLTTIEAQQFGKPVIAFKGGGVLETVTEKTGIFFFPQTKEAIKEVLQKFVKRTFNEEDCVKQAEKFSLVQFKKQFMKTLGNLP